MSQPMEMGSQDPNWLCLSQDPMPIDEVGAKKLRAHVIMSHGLCVNKSSLPSNPVETIDLRNSKPNVIVVMNCNPIPQKMPCNLANLWNKLNKFNGCINTIAELMINLNDIYFPEHINNDQSGLCYFFDRCPNIFLTPETKNWRDGIYELPCGEFSKENANYRNPVQKDINNLSCFKDLDSYINYIHCRDRKNLHIVIVFACTNPIDQSNLEKTSYDNPKLKYCNIYPVKYKPSSVIIDSINKKWSAIKIGGAPTIFILGRRRKIYYKNKNKKIEYIRYNNQLITLKKAEKLQFNS